MINERIEAGTFILLPLNDGGEQQYEVLYTFTDDATEKEYMVLAPDEGENSNGEVEITAIRYEIEGEEINIYPVETDAEWEMVEGTLEEYMNQLRNREQ